MAGKKKYGTKNERNMKMRTITQGPRSRVGWEGKTFASERCGTR